MSVSPNSRRSGRLSRLGSSLSRRSVFSGSSGCGRFGISGGLNSVKDGTCPTESMASERNKADSATHAIATAVLRFSLIDLPSVHSIEIKKIIPKIKTMDQDKDDYVSFIHLKLGAGSC